MIGIADEDHGDATEEKKSIRRVGDAVIDELDPARRRAAPLDCATRSVIHTEYVTFEPTATTAAST